ncbi:MAG: right-handed parallel beta-helix repeat-containing protein [Acidobacteria bacterium]|nr:right-handed parallel beta-helix repeat-containing protein [Acidobacteriota bacterium]
MRKIFKRVATLLLLAVCLNASGFAQESRRLLTARNPMALVPSPLVPAPPMPSQQGSSAARQELSENEGISVKRFGARGDGKTDDTAAIRAAVQAIAGAGGGRLFFPNGIYPVSSAIDLPSGITIAGASGAYNGSCQIRLTAAGQKIFTIGENRRRISIHDIELKAAPASTSPYRIMEKTIGIDARGKAPNSSFEIEFRNLSITGFDRGISAEDSQGARAWQFDDVLIDHCTFAENNYGIYVDSQNASYWKINNCWIVSMSGGYGIYLKSSGFVTIDTTTGGGPPLARVRGVQPGKTFIYIGGAHGTITLIETQCEEEENFMEVVEPSNYSYPITVMSCIIGPKVMLRANCVYVSIGNFYGAGVVQAVDKGTDVLIHSLGDVAEMPLNSGRTPKGATPFQMQYNSRVVFGTNIYGVEIGNEATFSKNVGIGMSPSADALLNLATPNDNYVQLRLGNTQGYYYDLFRDTTGYLSFRGNQRGYTGFRFNGDLVPAQNRTGNVGTAEQRWNSLHAVQVVSGDAILSDKETGEELYRIREDKDNIYFDDIRTGKQLMRLDREGNLHVSGKVVENSQ